MTERDMIQLKDSITMPSEMADALLQNCSQPAPKHYRYSRYSKICAALAAAFCLIAVGSTSYAAYNVYQEKQLVIFMDYNLTQEEKEALGDELAQMPEITSCQYVSGSNAWDEFQTNYLTEELAASFEENPLKDSDNYQVSVRLGTDTQAVRDKISRLDGVRQITTVRELEAIKIETVYITNIETGEPIEATIVMIPVDWNTDEEWTESVATMVWTTIETDSNKE